MQKNNLILAHGGVEGYDLIVRRYSSEIKARIRKLRSLGRSYGEINAELGEKLAKSTLSELCKGVKLPSNYAKRIKKLTYKNISKARAIAYEMTKIKREEYFKDLKIINLPISGLIKNKEIAKIALAMLCLGEASKYSKKSRSFSLGNSDPRIIVIFLRLLKYCFEFDIHKVRCRVQCRADQNTDELEIFWQKVTGVPKELFSSPLIDPRTVGKPTKKLDYKGVLRVDYFDVKVQHDLESLAHLIYNEASTLGPW